MDTQENTLTFYYEAVGLKDVMLYSLGLAASFGAIVFLLMRVLRSKADRDHKDSRP